MSKSQSKEKKFFTKQSEDYNRWYTDVVQTAGLADYSPVKGCMVIKPYGYAIWEKVQDELNKRIKAAGAQNCYFPLFIPESFLQKEADHVEGFAPEAAVVTHGGGEKLANPLIIRPTSETIMYATFAEWIHSYRDLPLKINQWANVVRWEKRTRLFLRTTEFLWQEGHTAHATFEEAEEETIRALRMYEEFDKTVLAVPVYTGQKSKSEAFKGAYRTLTTEAISKENKAIQAGTSHNLGQNFSKAFNIQYLDSTNELQYAWNTSWGLSTRIIGTLVMIHGDDQGLILPPNVAPYQVVIIPIIPKETMRSQVLEAAIPLKQALEDKGVRVQLDDREWLTPGFKFNDWEMKGVPLRLEIGPKDIEKNQVVTVRRDTGEKQFVKKEEFLENCVKILNDLHRGIYEKALKYKNDHTQTVSNYEEFKQVVEEVGFAEAYWDGSEETEQVIKEETKATCRCIPLDDAGNIMEDTSGRCVKSGNPSKYKALFAKAY
jgi:prolyl-tRNA synthetase